VRYCDGSVIAQMGQPDMRTPIAYGLAWPDRITAGVQSLSLTQLAALNFMEPDLQRFPCLSLAFQAGKQGGTAPVILNAANEIAVAAFLDNALRYLQISEVVERVLNMITPSTPSSLEDVLEVDARSRVLATDVIQRLHS